MDDKLGQVEINKIRKKYFFVFSLGSNFQQEVLVLSVSRDIHEG